MVNGTPTRVSSAPDELTAALPLLSKLITVLLVSPPPVMASMPAPAVTCECKTCLRRRRSYLLQFRTRSVIDRRVASIVGLTRMRCGRSEFVFCAITSSIVGRMNIVCSLIAALIVLIAVPGCTVAPPASSGASADQAQLESATQFVKDCGECPQLVAIPAGRFEMGAVDGDADSLPVRTVRVSAFLLGRTEVTYGQWKAVMGTHSRSRSACSDVCPVLRVSWQDAQLYVKLLSERTGRRYRLPSEAEWEYAARAGGTGNWGLGSDDAYLDGVAWYGSNSLGRAHAVGSKEANAFGLYDMHGNVWEWVQDVWHDGYKGAPTDGSAWMSGGDQERRVLRGGSWYDKPMSLRSAYRSWNTPVIHHYGAGLRVARDL